MAIQHNNIDILDAAKNTKAPFTWECSNKIGDITLPLNLFISIKVYLTENNVPPVRLYKVHNNRLIFSDSNNVVIGYFYIGSNTSGDGFIYDDNGLIRGHVVAMEEMPAIFRAISISNPGGITTTPDDFILLPKCHVSMFKGKCKVIKVNYGDTETKTHTRGDVVIKGDRGLIIDKDNNDTVSFSIYNDLKIETDIGIGKGNGIQKITIKGPLATSGYSEYTVSDKHFLIKHKLASNLRIVTDLDQIKLKGVTDV